MLFRFSERRVVSIQMRLELGALVAVAQPPQTVFQAVELLLVAVNQAAQTVPTVRQFVTLPRQFTLPSD